MLSSCYHHLVSSTDTSTCSHHAIIILLARQTHRHALIMLSSSCDFDRHIDMLTWMLSSCYHHLVSSTDISTYSHDAVIIMWVRQTHRHALIMISSSCEFDRHIDMLSSWYHWGRQTHLRHATIILWVRQTHRHALIMISSSCEFDRHIDILTWCCHHHVSSTDTSTCSHHDISSCEFDTESTDTSTCSHHDIIEVDKHIFVTLPSYCEFDRRIVIIDSSSCYHHEVSSLRLTRKHALPARTPFHTADAMLLTGQWNMKLRNVRTRF